MYHLNTRSVSLILVTSLLILYLSSGRALGDEGRFVVITVMDGNTGKPLENVEVKIIHPGGEEVLGITGSDGVLSVQLEPGRYEIRTALKIFGSRLWWGSYFLEVGSSSTGRLDAEIVVSNPFIPVRYLPLAVYGISILLVFLFLHWAVISRLGRKHVATATT